ncbi:MAG: peptidylprolyl isomerase [bacterium]|nr:peptidylprolyl isomerase [bacterium]MDD5354144.1 peptidylprolyl isomerase [bacterium]MDD5756646.1 peptidylprolyl isomerase [bacterium]
MNRVRLAKVIGLITLLGLLGSSMLLAKVVNKTVAVVNNEIITLEDFNKKTGPMIEQYRQAYKGADAEEKLKEMKKEMLNQMVEEKLLRQEAKKQNIIVTKQDIQKGVDEVKKRFKPDNNYQEYKDELKRQGYTEKVFENDIKEQLMVMQLIDKEIKSKAVLPTEAEVQKYYDEHKKELKQDEQVRARHILVRVEEKADLKTQSAALKKIKEIQDKIKKGNDFSALAKEYSDDPGSKENGGDLGFFTKETMVPEFSKAAFALKPGQVSDAVKTSFGYHLIKVEETKPAKQLALDDEVPVGNGKNVKIKEYVQNMLYQQSMEKKFEEWLKDLKGKSKIETHELE